MITASDVVSGVALVGVALLFQAGAFSALTLTIAWSVVFFFASAGASAAYLTVSEIFPMETRAMAIALFYAVGTGLGGIIGPLLVGRLVDTEKLGAVAGGYYLGAALMVFAGVVEWLVGVDAENQALEDIASPLAARAESVSAPRAAA
jgi:MFS family permease